MRCQVTRILHRFVRRCAAALLLAAVLLVSPASRGFAQKVYVTGSKNQFGTVDVKTGEYTNIATLMMPLAGITRADDGTLYGAGFNGRLYTVDSKTGALKAQNLGADLNSAAASNSTTVFATNESSILVYNIKDRKETTVGAVDLPTGYQTNFGALALGPDGKLYQALIDMSGATKNDVFRVYDPATGKKLSGNDDAMARNLRGFTFIDKQLYAFQAAGNKGDQSNTLFTITDGKAKSTGVKLTLPGGGAVWGACPVPEMNAVAAFALLLMGAAIASQVNRVPKRTGCS